VQSLEEQQCVLSELKSLREEGVKIKGVDDDKRASEAPGNVMIHSLAGYLTEEEAQRELFLLRDAMHEKLASLHGTGSEHAPQALRDLRVSRTRGLELQKDFILSLHYREREYRELAISSPYDKTFQWMFDKDPRRKNGGFPRWLASSSNLFWITGKAGSGKSTLMKYISDFKSGGEGALQCQKHLREWSGKWKLTTASFYFWGSGAGIQASQRAMFQSILFELLQERSDVISRVAPMSWELACLFDTPFPESWTEEGLRELLLDVVTELSKEFKVCLFIDGLDEFSGDPEALIAVIKRISHLPVKICVSSRPWLEFESAFGRGPSLQVQDLTYPDIKHFAKSHFEKSEGFARLMMREPEYAAKLIDQIITKSSGVFLWVRIVVQSLVTGLTNDDRIRDLQERLNALPPDLEQLYGKILKDLDPFYLAHASQYFQLMLANDNSAEALLLSFADEEEKNFAIRMPPGPLSSQERARRVETLKRRLNSRCKGLLEIGPDDRVNFLHRTVRDFLVTPENLTKLENATEGSWDAHLQLCSAAYCMIKTFLRENSADADRGLWIAKCLGPASRVVTGKHYMIDILDSLRKNAKTHPCLLPPTLYDSYPEENLCLRKSSGFVFEDGFLALATRFGITEYLRARAPPGALSSVLFREGPKTIWVDLPSRSFRRRLRWFTRIFRSEQPNVPTPRSTQTGSLPLAMSAPLPLLLDACFAFPPNHELFRCLLDQEADYNLRLGDDERFAFQFRYARDGLFLVKSIPVLAVVVAAAIIITGSRSDPIEQRKLWTLWVQVLTVFKEFGAQFDHQLARTVADSFRRNVDGVSSFSLMNAAKDVKTLVECVQSKNDRNINWAALRYHLRLDLAPLDFSFD
jgi:hypothetical protein